MSFSPGSMRSGTVFPLLVLLLLVFCFSSHPSWFVVNIRCVELTADVDVWHKGQEIGREEEGEMETQET